MVKEVCNYCNSSNEGFHKKIRNGFICQKCLQEAQQNVLVAEKKLQKHRYLANPVFPIISIIVEVIAILIGHPWIGIFLIFTAYSFYSDQHKDTEKLKYLEGVESAAKTKLRAIYSQFIELPPDWRDRRKLVQKRDNSKCRECGLSFYSQYGFHVHHIIPKSKAESSHELSNLILLCERCHAKRHPWMM